jgi:hypothetical protein
MVNGGVGGLLQKRVQISNAPTQAKHVPGESWDDDFASDVSILRLKREGVAKKDPSASEEQDQKTLRPNKNSPNVPLKPLPPVHESANFKRASSAVIDDYSDIAAGAEDADLESKLARLKVSSLSKSPSTKLTAS